MVFLCFCIAGEGGELFCRWARTLEIPRNSNTRMALTNGMEKGRLQHVFFYCCHLSLIYRHTLPNYSKISSS